MHDSDPIRSAEDFGARLRARRKELGLTQSQVADVIGVNRRVLSQLERGKATVQLHIALDAALAIGLDVRMMQRA
jgi:transcriptional regulator with XRE-family HTH domain